MDDLPLRAGDHNGATGARRVLHAAVIGRVTVDAAELDAAERGREALLARDPDRDQRDWPRPVRLLL